MRRTKIGIGYEAWFNVVGWGRLEAEAILGRYRSLDAGVIRQHTRWAWQWDAKEVSGRRQCGP